MSPLANRFLSAVRLCTGPLAIKRRLTEAWTEHLDNIAPDELPENLRQDFIELRKAMYTHIPLPIETAPQASIRKMSVGEVALHTDTIILLYTRIVMQNYANEEQNKGERNSVINIERFAKSVQTLN